MFQIVIPLKQHTPLIHFEVDQDLATLRASELKPKLDNFLLKQLRLAGRAIPESWKVGGADRNTRKVKETSLDYKVKIIAKAEHFVKEQSGDISFPFINHRGRNDTFKFPCYFADMGENNQTKKNFFSFYKEITVIIHCRHAELLNTISQNIANFFIHTNFGARQSKGFGSFYPSDHNAYPLLKPQTSLFYEVIAEEKNPPNNNFIGLNKPTRQFMQMHMLFGYIHLLYSTLRSGHNVGYGANQYYFKSMMFMYAKDRLGATWDKKAIKNAFFSYELGDQKRDHPNKDILTYQGNQEYLMRDLLGLATDSNWKSYNNAKLKTKSIDGDIARFKSPITFKPIEITKKKYRIYLHFDQESVNKMLGKEFEISYLSKKLFLKTPPVGKFNLAEFVLFALQINLEKHILIKTSEGFDVKTIKMIYKQLLNSQTKS